MITGQALVVDGGVVHPDDRRRGSPSTGAPRTCAPGRSPPTAPSSPRPPPRPAPRRSPPDGFEPALLALVGRWLAPGVRTDVDRLRHGRRPRRLGRGAPTPRSPAPRRRPPSPARRPPTRASPCASCPACARTGPPTSCAARRPRSPACSPPSPASTASPACPAPTPSGRTSRAGEVVSFASYMTGEIFALLAGTSVLRKTRRHRRLVRARTSSQAVEDGLVAPRAGRPRASSALRAEALLHGLAPERARARLSGLLIGAELAAARPYWLGRDLVLIGAAGARRRPTATRWRSPASAARRRRRHRDDPRRPRRRPRPAPGRKEPRMSRRLIAILRGVDPRPRRRDRRRDRRRRHRLDRGAAELARAAPQHRRDAGRRRRPRPHRRRHRADPRGGARRRRHRRQLHRLAERRPAGHRPHQGARPRLLPRRLHARPNASPRSPPAPTR